MTCPEEAEPTKGGCGSCSRVCVHTEKDAPVTCPFLYVSGE